MLTTPTLAICSQTRASRRPLQMLSSALLRLIPLVRHASARQARMDARQSSGVDAWKQCSGQRRLSSISIANSRGGMLLKIVKLVSKRKIQVRILLEWSDVHSSLSDVFDGVQFT